MPLRVAFVGRLVPYKGADMLIEATAELIKAGTLILDIIGDGPERPFLRSLADRLGLGSGVHLDGWVPHHDMADRLRRSDVFGFPSVREFGGGVVLEAMALGLVPVVADYAGPAELVTDDTGYRIPMASREDLIARFRERFEALVASPELLRPMGQRARARVLELFTWDAKARQMLEVYRWVLGQRGKPDFGRPLARLA
jgi:glycosyltransferase involved in cell wall biosynthesis